MEKCVLTSLEVSKNAVVFSLLFIFSNNPIANNKKMTVNIVNNIMNGVA